MLFRSALDDAVAFQDHEQAVHGAFMQVEFFGKLHQAGIETIAGQSIDDGERPVEDLNAVGGWLCLTI